MALINSHFTTLTDSYLFSRIAERVDQFAANADAADVISLGIGDVTQGISSLASDAMVEASKELASSETFHGYGPEQGYLFLRESIAAVHYGSRNIDIDPDEIFISDGAKSDVANIQELFSSTCTIGMNDPVYPVYIDSNVIAGRTQEWDGKRYTGAVYTPLDAAHGYRFLVPDQRVDVLYVCSPNNPTGAVATREELAALVDYAIEHKAVIIYDAAYESFIRNTDMPRTIYEIPRAKFCAIECNSLSKSAGFTGVRCAYTVIPKTVLGYDAAGNTYSLRDLWFRRQSTKFNGVAYPVQRAAAAMFTPQGQAQIRELTDYYLKNATIIRALLEESSLEFIGGINAPYIWVNAQRDSWECFDLFLHHAQVVVTPGIGFGAAGADHFRISAFAQREKVINAVQRLRSILLQTWKK